MRTMVFLLLFFPALCSASGVLQAWFAPPPAGSNRVSLVLRNTGDDDINIVVYTLPWLMKDGKLMNSAVMQLTTQDGRRVGYRGAFYEPDLSDPERFVTIKPGAEKRYDADMSVNYDMVPGQYYRVDSLMRMKYLDHALASYPDRSNSVLRSLYRVAAATPAIFVAAPVACPDPIAGGGC